MTRSLIRSLVALAFAALAVPAASSAAGPEVEPPGAGFQASAAGSADDPGCRSKSVIAFKGAPESRVRHAARVRCSDVRVRARCSANLLQDGERISRERAAGGQGCRAAAPFADSEEYPAGTEFTQRYRFKLRLKNDRARWTGTTDDCPRRSRDRRTLVCKGSHETTAPVRSVERIRS